MSDLDVLTSELSGLVSLFGEAVDDLGRFEPVEAETLPDIYRDLLAHHRHMTESIERLHGSPAGLRVLERTANGDSYARTILLTRPSDGAVVQFGVMRVRLDSLSDELRRKIEGERTPLGRLLAEHNVLRRVELGMLFRVTVGPSLSRWLEIPQKSVTYGRTAAIHVHGERAVELLEIVVPV